MVPLFVQTLLLTAAAYFVGAAVACLVRRSFFHAAARQAPAPGHPVEPLPDISRRASGLGRSVPAAASARAPASCASAARSGRRRAGASAGPQAHSRHRRRSGGAPQHAGHPPLRGDRGLDAARGEAHRRGPRPRETASAGRTGSSRRRCWPRAATRITRRARRAARSPMPPPPPTKASRRGHRAGRCRSAGRVRPAGIDRGCRGGRRRGLDGRAGVPPRRPLQTTPPDVSGRAAFAAAAPRQEPAPAQAAPVPSASAGVYRCVRPPGNARQPASASAASTARSRAAGRAGRHPLLADRALDAGRGGALRPPQLGAAGRIGRENWIEQAQILSRGGDTAFSRDYDRRARAATRDRRRRASAGRVDASSANAGTTGGQAPTAARLRRTAVGALRGLPGRRRRPAWPPARARSLRSARAR